MGQRFREQSLSNSILFFRCGRESQCKLHEPRVQERHAHFERMAHAHGIRIAQEHVHKIRASFQPGNGAKSVQISSFARCVR